MGTSLGAPDQPFGLVEELGGGQQDELLASTVGGEGVSLALAMKVRLVAV